MGLSIGALTERFVHMDEECHRPKVKTHRSKKFSTYPTVLEVFLAMYIELRAGFETMCRAC
jgi:hypothetical protein